MANSPSTRYDDNGTLVERAIASDVAGDPDEQDAVTGRENDKAPANSTFAERAKTRVKQVTTADAEDKSVKSKRASSK